MKKVFSNNCSRRVVVDAGLRLAMLLLIVAGVLSSCTKEPFWNNITGGDEGKTEVSLRLKVPGDFAKPSSRALLLEDENAVVDVAVLVFNDADQLVDIKTSSTINVAAEGIRTFSVNINPDATSNRLVVLANMAANNIVVDLGSLSGTSYAQIWKKFNVPATSELYELGGVIPMWGETAKKKITPGGAIDLIPLVRSIARIDVGVGRPSANSSIASGFTWANEEGIPFELTSVVVFKSGNSFYVISSPANFSGKAIAPTVDGVGQNGTFTYTSIKDGLYTTQDIYVSEANVIQGGRSGDANHKERMAIVVGGVYNGKLNYYRLDFQSAGNLIDVLRNHLYQFNITGVKGPGYGTAEEAYNSLSVNMTCELVEWDDALIDEVVFDGQYYFGIDKREVVFSPKGGEEQIVHVKTNVKDWSMTHSGIIPDLSANGTTEYGISAEQDHYFSYKIDKVDPNNPIDHRYTLTIKSKKHNINNEQIIRLDEWIIVAKRIRIPNFKVDQQYSALYMTVDKGQEVRFFPEGTIRASEGNTNKPFVIEVMALRNVKIERSGGASWLTSDFFGGSDLKWAPTLADGLRHAIINITIPYWTDSDGDSDRTSTITITPDGDAPVIVTFKQEAPYIHMTPSVFFSRSDVNAVRGAYLTTNLPKQHWTLSKEAKSESFIELADQGDNGLVYLVQSDPRSARMDIKATMAGLPPQAVSRRLTAAFSATGLSDLTVSATCDVSIGSGDQKWKPFWMFKPLSGEWSSDTHIGSDKSESYIIPWNMNSFSFGVETSSGVEYVPYSDGTNDKFNPSSVNFSGSGSDFTGVVTLVPNPNNNLIEDFKIRLAPIWSRPELSEEELVMHFSRGYQRYAHNGNTNLIGVSGLANHTGSVTVTSNIYWGASITTGGGYGKIGLAAGSVNLTSTTKDDSKGLLPIRDNASFRHNTPLYYSIAKYTALKKVTDAVVEYRDVIISFVNNSPTSTDGSKATAPEVVSFRQFEPVLRPTASVGVSDETISADVKTYDISVETNLPGWTVKAYDGATGTTPLAGFSVTTHTTPVANHAATHAECKITIPAYTNTTAARTIRLVLSSTEFPGAEDDQLIATIAQSKMMPKGGSSDRITWSNGKYVITQDPTDAGLYFKYGSVIGVYSANGSNQTLPGSNTDTFDVYDVPINFSTAVISGTSTEGWLTIPYVSENVNIDKAYHTVDNVKAGKGDPCRLVNLDLDDIKKKIAAGTLTADDIDNKTWMLPTLQDNVDFSGFLVGTYTGIAWWVANSSPFSRVAGAEFPKRDGGGVSKFLPAAGLRSLMGGAVASQGSYGYYWVSSSRDAATGHHLYFYNSYVVPQGNSSKANGINIRCVPQ